MTRRDDRPPRSQSTGSEQSERRVILPPPDKPWLKPFQPGICPNPAGRPRTLERLARALTNDGADCVQLWLRMLRGDEPGNRRSPRPQMARLGLAAACRAGFRQAP